MRECLFSVSFFFLIFVHILCSSSSSLVRCSPVAPALYVFGDSLFDSGNNNFLPTLARANFRPYGSNFVRGATGRFTNGRTVADFIAEYLGLPYAPPYLSFRKRAVLTGLNYASGSCGILPETGRQLGKCLNLNDQIELFQWTINFELQRHLESTNAVEDHLAKSIFVFSIGSNDYINNYLEPRFSNTSKIYSPQQFAQLLIDELAQGFKRLYTLGARKIVMFEIGPVGCIPSISKKHKVICVEGVNGLVSHFNIRLPAMMKNLTHTLKGSTFVAGHAHWLGYDAVKNPSEYGLDDSSNPCCTTWMNGTSGCIPMLRPCSNSNSHYFWDGFHLTENIYEKIAELCFNGTSICKPVSMRDLALV